MDSKKMNIVQNNYSLKNHNTFGFDLFSGYFFAFDSVDSLRVLIDNGFAKYNSVQILGAGSNILFTKNVTGIVIHPMLQGNTVISENEEFVFVKSSSGEIWDSFVAYSVAHGYGGIENLSGIPGCVGACPIQNIGAYGTEVKDTISEVEVIDLRTGEISIFDNKDCQFGYRDSVFKNEFRGKYIILSVIFKLSKKHTYNISYGDIEKEVQVLGDINLQNIRQAILNIRSVKLPDPVVLGNAGSFFKNPVVDLRQLNFVKQINKDVPYYKLPFDNFKIPAGWLIEQCGWKGKRAGNVGVHDKQALVLVNYGKGTGADILKLSETIINSVQEKFHIAISPEVNIV